MGDKGGQDPRESGHTIQQRETRGILGDKGRQDLEIEPTSQHFHVLLLEVALLLLLLEFFVLLKPANAMNWLISSSQTPFCHVLSVQSNHHQKLNPQQLHHVVLPRLPLILQLHQAVHLHQGLLMGSLWHT